VRWITSVSVVGITIITAALVVLVAAFNGIEKIVAELYSDYDAAVTIRSSKGKTFNENTVSLASLNKIPGIQSTSRAVEEIVVLKRDKKWVNAHMVGVDSNYMAACKIDSHIVEGKAKFSIGKEDCGIIGATLLDKLEGYISELNGGQELMIYTPLRDAPMVFHKSPFKVTPLWISGKMNYNRDVNENELLVPLEFARGQLDYDSAITAIYVSLKPETDAEVVRDQIKSKLGSNFVVKTAAEKNELIFKTAKTEKKILVFILAFIFVLAAFNLIASINMLYNEKSENLQTLYRIGITQKAIFKIFFFEGLLIASRGIFFGLIIGIAVCLLQLQFSLLEMPNAMGKAFPISFSVSDGIMIVGLVSVLSLITSFVPVWFLVYRSNR
jgi:lipoprotein-releasing system permease protein